MESTTPEDKQYILSNYPRLFAQTVESYTWERREKQENFSKTIDGIVKEVLKMDVSFDTIGSSSESIHKLLLKSEVVNKRQAYVAQCSKVKHATLCLKLDCVDFILLLKLQKCGYSCMYLLQF